VRGVEQLLYSCKRCIASLFTNRVISYREDMKFDHFSVALSIGVQKMVRSDRACSGVMFSADTETGFRDVCLITGAFGIALRSGKGWRNKVVVVRFILQVKQLPANPVVLFRCTRVPSPERHYTLAETAFGVGACMRRLAARTFVGSLSGNVPIGSRTRFQVVLIITAALSYHADAAATSPKYPPTLVNAEFCVAAPMVRRMKFTNVTARMNPTTNETRSAATKE